MRSHSEWVADLKGCLGSGRTITPTTTAHFRDPDDVSAATSQHRHDFHSWAPLTWKATF